MNNTYRARAAIRKIEFQVLDSPEARLMFAIVSCAISDLTRFGTREAATNRRSAAAFLKNDMPYADLCGLNSGWIRKVIADAGLKV